MEGRIAWTGDEDALADTAESWRAAGATHIAVNTMRRQAHSVDDHIAALARAAVVLNPRGGRAPAPFA